MVWGLCESAEDGFRNCEGLCRIMGGSVRSCIGTM